MKLKAFVIAYIILWVLLLIAGLFMMLVGQEPTQEDVETMFMIPYEVAAAAHGRYGPDYLQYLTEICVRTGFDWETYQSADIADLMDQIDIELSPEEISENCTTDGPSKSIYDILVASYGRYETFFVPDTYYKYLVSVPDEPANGGTGSGNTSGGKPPTGGKENQGGGNNQAGEPGNGSAGHNGGGGTHWTTVTVIMRYRLTINDDFGNARSFGGDRKHLGNDIMGTKGIPLVSVSDGVVTNIGWNTLGGNRVGITATSPSKSINDISEGNPYKTYYYYAHLKDINPSLKKGHSVKAGELIGTIGDSGYGTDGTTGKFAPHLHFQIGLISPEMDEYLWIDPNPVIRMHEKNREEIDIKDVYEMIDHNYSGHGNNLREVEENADKRERK